MIRFRYAVTLSNTKLKSKRSLLIVSIIISSILFATLIAGIIIFTGAQKSALAFIQKANEGVYRVEVNPVLPSNIYSYDRPLSIDTINNLRQLQKVYYSQLEKTYKAAGIKYDPSLEISPLKPASYFSETTPEAQRYDIDNASPVIAYDQNLKIDAYVNIAKNKASDLKHIGDTYGASGYYESSHSSSLSIPNMMLLKKGKEDFSDTEFNTGDSSSYGYSTNAIHNGMYEMKDETLLKRYLLPNITNSQLSGIPVIVTAQELATLYGKDKSINTEPEDPKSKSIWLKNIQEKFAGYTYQACYRNNTELQTIQKIQRDYADVVNNRSNKDFIASALQYNLPIDSCGEITVKSDTRTNDEKASDAKAIDDQKKLGTYVAPEHKLLTFEVVGIFNAKHYSDANASIQSYLQNLLSTDNTSFSALIPQQMYDVLPTSMKFIKEKPKSILESDGFSKVGLVSHVLNFNAIDQARSFMAKETCPGYDSGCKKLFTANPYGSNYLILDEISKLFNKLMLYGLPAVLGLAAIIIWFTMIRVMSENRKETAVYRAMGAKRSDIMAIYLTYGMTVAFRIAIVSFLLGVALAYVVDYIYGSQLTAIATSSFGVVNDGMQFSLFNLSSQYILVVVAAIFIVSFLAILQPLIRSVRRSPIEDMRSE